MNFQTPYQAFFTLLNVGLQAAEAKHAFPGRAVDAYWRVLKPEVTGASTNFLQWVEPAVAVKDYVAFSYDGAPAPFWLTSAGL